MWCEGAAALHYSVVCSWAETVTYGTHVIVTHSLFSAIGVLFFPSVLCTMRLQ